MPATKVVGMTVAPDCFCMAVRPAEKEFYLKGISSVVNRIPFFGGYKYSGVGT